MKIIPIRKRQSLHTEIRKKRFSHVPEKKKATRREEEVFQNYKSAGFASANLNGLKSKHNFLIMVATFRTFKKWSINEYQKLDIS